MFRFHLIKFVVNPIIFVPADKTVLKGQDVSFNCTADGSPTPVVYWRNSNDNTTISKINILVLKNVTNKDEQTYVCTAVNKGKRVTAKVTLTVHGK